MSSKEFQESTASLDNLDKYLLFLNKKCEEMNQDQILLSAKMLNKYKITVESQEINTILRNFIENIDKVTDPDFLIQIIEYLFPYCPQSNINFLNSFLCIIHKNFTVLIQNHFKNLLKFYTSFMTDSIENDENIWKTLTDVYLNQYEHSSPSDEIEIIHYFFKANKVSSLVLEKFTQKFSEKLFEFKSIYENNEKVKNNLLMLYYAVRVVIEELQKKNKESSKNNVDDNEIQKIFNLLRPFLDIISDILKNNYDLEKFFKESKIKENQIISEQNQKIYKEIQLQELLTKPIIPNKL